MSINKKKQQEELVEVFDPKGRLDEKMDFFIKVVLGVFVVAFITMLIMVGTLIFDSFHINSATYKEYSDKIEAQNILLETNRQLLEENKKNQEIIKGLLNRK